MVNLIRDHHLWTRDTIKNVSGDVTLLIDGDTIIDRNVANTSAGEYIGLDIDYDKVVEYSTYDERLGKSHWAVPGPDGKLGFGGSCFPKDLNALIYVSEELGFYPNVLHGAWNTNLRVRPDKDWENLIGRAVTEE